MKTNENDILKFIEPVFHFCLKRLNNRQESEDLASEIMMYVLDGLSKYNIDSLESWVWRIAHNRYARYIDSKNRNLQFASREVLEQIPDDYNLLDEAFVSDEYQIVFKCLHTLSVEYKNILVDYYIGEMSVKQLAGKYSLTESAVKWRLNISREKIRNRIGDHIMDKVYKRIIWNTTCCNGSMNSDQYLHTQIARAICEAAYEKPLTIEEISLKTGLPTMYIEDELPRLIYGDAIEQIGNKYATNFIILRLNDKKNMETKFAPIIGDIVDHFEEMFRKRENAIENMSFYGSCFGMKRLGYIAIPASLRKRIGNIKQSIGLTNGKFPPRKDGGYGWFIVEETTDERERVGEYNSGCNITDGDEGFVYYYHIAKYFNINVYHNGGTCWLAAKKIPEQTTNGVIPDGLFSEDDIVRLLKVNLITKDQSGYKLNFACFASEEYSAFTALFDMDDEKLDRLLEDIIRDITVSFKAFVPKRLNSQINQWVSGYVHSIIGFVTDELISRGVLERPDEEKPLTHGVFYVSGTMLVSP